MFGVLGVARLVELHHLENLAAALVGRRQGLQVLVQVRFHLALGLHHEAQVPAVAAQAGEGADGVAAGIPERVEQAGAAVQFAQAVGAPAQVVGLFLCGIKQVRAGGRVTGDCCLAEIQALGADFAHMVDPHQPRRMADLVRLQHHLGGVAGRVGAGGRWVAEDRIQGALGFGQQVVQGRLYAGGGHGGALQWGRLDSRRWPAACQGRGRVPFRG